MAINNNQIENKPRSIQAGIVPVTDGSSGAFYPKSVSGIVEAFYKDNAGREIQLTLDGSSIGGGGSGSVNDGSNLSSSGAGKVEIFAGKTSDVLNFKRIVAGSGVTVSQTSNEITISASGGGGGEANTASNLGSGALLFSGKTGVNLAFRSLVAGSGVSINQGTNEITISATGSGEANTASSVGSGTSIFRQKSGVNLQFKSLVAGTGVTITNSNPDEVVINSSGGGGGEANTASNSASGTGAGLIFKQKSGVDLVFKKIKSGSANLTIVNGTDDITLDAPNAGGHLTQILSFDSGNIVIRASGTQTDLAAVTATKDFTTASTSTVILNRPTSVVYHSVNVTFLASETTGRTLVDLVAPDMNGATSPDKALRPFAHRLNPTYGTNGTTSSFSSAGGSLFRTSMGGYTAGLEQKGTFFF